MAVFPKSAGEELPATDWNIVAAQAADALKPTGNLAGLADPAAARDNLELADIAASGEYTDLTGAPTDTNDADGGLDFIDAGGELLGRITEEGVWELPGASFAADGTAIDDLTATQAEITTAEIADLTSPDATLGETEHTANDAAAMLEIVDEGMEVLERTETDGSKALPGINISRTDSAPAVEIVDDGMEVQLRVSVLGTLLPGVQIDRDDGAAGLRIIDEGMEVLASFNAAGASSGFGGASADEHGDDELGWRNAANLARAAQMATRQDLWVARPVWAYNHVIAYGQSLAAGSEGTPPLSVVAKYDNLMFGDKTTSASNAMPGANNATPPTWVITGSEAFNPLEETVFNASETVLSGALNTFRRYHLRDQLLIADTTRRMVGNGAGVGGQAIAALSKGADPNLYNRIPSLVDQALNYAGGLPATYGVVAVLWLQGESNQTTAIGTYKPLLQAFRSDVTADIMSVTEQPDPPAVFTYQTTAPNSNFDNADLGVQMGQLEWALEGPGVWMIGPSYPYPDSNNLHLVANGYRWMGSQFGKVMHRVLTLGQDWRPLYATRATRRGREIIVDFHVPYPPLVIDDPYLQTGWTVGETATGEANSQYASPDEGFRVISTTDEIQAIDSVTLISETQVRIVLELEPAISLDLLVRIAGAGSAGHASLRDSDPALADDIYLDGQPGQVDGEANATLSGERYPLWNWVVAQQIAVED